MGQSINALPQIKESLEVQGPHAQQYDLDATLHHELMMPTSRASAWPIGNTSANISVETGETELGCRRGLGSRLGF